jgi:F-type H+-transporting ATPase subunit beta
MGRLEAALTGCDRILNDDFADYPESALYFIYAAWAESV